MEKKEHKETNLNRVMDERVNAEYSEVADLIKTMIQKMPQADPPAGLLPFVMEAVRTKKVPLWLRVRRWASSPRSLDFTPLQIAFATALSALVVFSVLSVQERGVRNIARTHQAALVQTALTKGPESKGSVPVVFALDMPDASSVHVVGSFNNWVPQPCELHRENGSARWMLTVQLKPGRYEYAFLVDGRHMPHPGAEALEDDGFGNKNTVLALEQEDDI
jgi:hypothetical protein